MPDFKMQQWNEDSLDLKQYPFAKAAYQAGKFAFVSDVVRLHALYHEGGIYLDTDIIVVKNLKDHLHYSFFAGEYRPGALNAAVIGSEASNPVLKELLDFYKNKKFDFLKLLTIPEVFDQIVWKHQGETVKLLPPPCFYPLPIENREEDFAGFIRPETYAVHLWNHSWKDEFALMKENRFFDSLILASKHFCSYPQVYRNWEYINRFRNLYWRNLKRYLKLKLSE